MRICMRMVRTREFGAAVACLGAVAYLQSLGRCGNGKDGAVYAVLEVVEDAATLGVGKR